MNLFCATPTCPICFLSSACVFYKGGNLLYTGINTNDTLETALVKIDQTIQNSIGTSGTAAQYWRGDKTWATLNKAAVGLSNVDNTSDVNKPISSATQNALDGKVPVTRTLTINGTTLDLSQDREWNFSPNLDPLEFDVNNRTVWNNGRGNIEGNTFFGQNTTASVASYQDTHITSYGSNVLPFGNGPRNTAVGSEINTHLWATAPTDGVFMGHNIRPSTSSVNEILIGNHISGTDSNSVVLGNALITKTRLRGEVQGGSFKKDGGLATEYLMADGSVSTGSSVNLDPLEFNVSNRTVWNNGIGDIDTNTFFGKDTYADTGGFSTAVDNVTLFGNSVFPKKTGGSRVTAIGSKIGGDYSPPAFVIDGVFIGHNISPSPYSSNQILIGNDISLTNSLEDYSNTVVLGSDLITKTILRGTINMTGLAVYADNATATADGLIVGDIYRTSTGDLKIVY
jgi:hypothetical protein